MSFDFLFVPGGTYLQAISKGHGFERLSQQCFNSPEIVGTGIRRGFKLFHVKV